MFNNCINDVFVSYSFSAINLLVTKINLRNETNIKIGKLLNFVWKAENSAKIVVFLKTSKKLLKLLKLTIVRVLVLVRQYFRWRTSSIKQQIAQIVRAHRHPTGASSRSTNKSNIRIERRRHSEGSRSRYEYQQTSNNWTQLR